MFREREPRKKKCSERERERARVGERGTASVCDSLFQYAEISIERFGIEMNSELQ